MNKIIPITLLMVSISFVPMANASITLRATIVSDSDINICKPNPMNPDAPFPKIPEINPVGPRPIPELTGTNKQMQCEEIEVKECDETGCYPVPYLICKPTPPPAPMPIQPFPELSYGDPVNLKSKALYAFNQERDPDCIFICCERDPKTGDCQLWCWKCPSGNMFADFIDNTIRWFDDITFDVQRWLFQ